MDGLAELSGSQSLVFDGIPLTITPISQREWPFNCLMIHSPRIVQHNFSVLPVLPVQDGNGTHQQNPTGHADNLSEIALHKIRRFWILIVRGNREIGTDANGQPKTYPKFPTQSRRRNRTNSGRQQGKSESRHQRAAKNFPETTLVKMSRFWILLVRGKTVSRFRQ